MTKKAIMLFVLIGLLSIPARGTEPIRVAAIFSQTGIAAIHNAPLIPLVQLAVDEVNERGGLLGRPVELIILDNKSTRIGSTLAAEKAVELQVMAVIGAHWSSHSLAQAPILQRAGIPMISPGSTNPKVTLIGDYIFRACFLDSFQGKAMARFAYTDLKARTAAVVKNIDEDYSLMLAEFFKNSFLKNGGKILLDESYRGKAVDFAEIIEEVKNLQPDVVFIPGYTRDSGLFIRQSVSMGVDATFLGGDAWDEIFEVGSDAVEGSYHSAPWHPQVPFLTSLHLIQLYREKYGKEITNVSAPLAYDAFMLLADAVRRAGTTERKQVRDALARTKDFQGATGVITFDENGDPLDKEVVIIKLEEGAANYVKTIKPSS